MAFDCFLKVDGIDGESTDSKHSKWIEVLSFSTGMNQPVSAVQSSAGGATSARVNMQDFSIVKHIDISSPKLAEACCTGKHFPAITVELCRAGGDKLKYMEYKLTNAIVSSISGGGTPGGADDVPTESVSFNFGKIEWTYTQQKRADGGGGGNASALWDLEKNTNA
jgi:type VI secretion system secreted protein Hcp